MLNAFRRMSRGVLNLLGEDSLLRGSEPCKVSIEHGVQVTVDDLVYVRDVATISNDLSPVVGDSLDHPDGAYTLDRKLQSNGVNTRFILIDRVV